MTLPPRSMPAFVSESGYMGSWCKANCFWLVVYGKIDSSTSKNFSRFTHVASHRYDRMEIHAEGDDIISAVKLGWAINAYGKPVSVGAPYLWIGNSEDGTPEFSEFQPGQCIGSCLYAFIGGVERQNYKGSEIILSPLDAMDEKKWKKLTDYVQEMGVSDQLVEAQRDVQKSGKPRTLTDQELKDWGILNAE